MVTGGRCLWAVSDRSDTCRWARLSGCLESRSRADLDMRPVSGADMTVADLSDGFWKQSGCTDAMRPDHSPGGRADCADIGRRVGDPCSVAASGTSRRAMCGSEAVSDGPIPGLPQGEHGPITRVRRDAVSVTGHTPVLVSLPAAARVTVHRVRPYGRCYARSGCHGLSPRRVARPMLSCGGCECAAVL